MVRELEATGAVKPLGWASTQDFLTVADGTKAKGPAAVRLAQAVEEPLLAPVGTALAAGWLSMAKAHVIRRAIDDLPGCGHDGRDPRDRMLDALTELCRRAQTATCCRSPTGPPHGSPPPSTTTT